MSPEIDLPKQPNYLWHWIGIIAAFLIGIYLFPRWTQPNAEERRAAVVNGSSDWYFIAKMPEVPTTDKDAVREARARFREWLTALGRAGFDEHLVTMCHRLAHARWHEADAVLVHLHFLRHADAHAASLSSLMCRAGYWCGLRWQRRLCRFPQTYHSLKRFRTEQIRRGDFAP